MHWLPTRASRLGHQLRALYRGGVDRDLVGAGVQQAPDVGDLADAAADRQRDEDLFGDLFDHVHDGLAFVAARGDVEEGDLVGALRVIAAGHFHRVPGVADADEVHALDHAAGVDVEAGDDALAPAWVRTAPAASAIASCRVNVSSYRARPTITPSMPSSSCSSRRRMSSSELTPAGGDHRNPDPAGQPRGGLDVHALHHAVAADVGVDDRHHAVALEVLGEVDHVVVRQLGPAVHRELAVAGVQSRR
jgi:hypothetical protein